MHAHETRVVEAREKASFGEETGAERVGVGRLAREGLQRVMDAQLRMLNLVHFAHAATAQKPDNAVDAESAGDRILHGTGRVRRYANTVRSAIRIPARPSPAIMPAESSVQGSEAEGRYLSASRRSPPPRKIVKLSWMDR